MNEDEKILNFFRKLYLIYGLGNIPRLSETEFENEYIELSFNENNFKMMKFLMQREWVTGRISTNDRCFTEKFVKEVIENS